MYYNQSVKKIISKMTSNKINFFFGKMSSIFILILITLVSLSVILRYIFSIGFTWLQDLYIWTHACFILFGIAYTLNKDGHVRIDILYRNFNEIKKKKINLIGSIIFGLPFCFFIITKGYDYFLRSFLISEDSKETGGLPNIYILKFFIFFMGILLSIELIQKIFDYFKRK